MRVTKGQNLFYSGDRVYEAIAQCPIADERGVISRWKISYRGRRGILYPKVVSKRELFETEEEATKAVFKKKLKGTDK